LWEDLTVEEHLYFYARLKGISAADEARAVKNSLDTVSLFDLRKRLSKALSGGEKRRLSIAIALVGNPSVVFLDEPTTGLDPEVRRLIWNIISDSKEGKSIILTTHSMEEAEALCGRIGIMAKGTLRCLANPTRLKQIYGSGFKLFFNSLEESTEKASKFIESQLPEGWKKIDAFATNVSYEFPAVDGTIGPLFDHIEAGKSSNGILDWGLGQTTLEEVFIHLIGQSDAEAAY
jgi:ABC-type multidrug transport system ATPase subunit